jgi:hypothetical protein
VIVELLPVNTNPFVVCWMPAAEPRNTGKPANSSVNPIWARAGRHPNRERAVQAGALPTSGC